MTVRRSAVRVAAGALALSALTAACGLKPDATESLKASGTAGGGGGVGNSSGANGGTGATNGYGGSTVPGANGSGGTTTAGGGTTFPGGGTGGTTGGTTGTTGGTGGTTGGGNVACGTPHGGDTTGITSSTINIGLHAPLTGTGTPFPNSSFQSGGNTFWQQPGHTVCGRRVNAEIQDDQYTPAHARQVCSAMAKRDFLVVGGGGTDQIQACATEPYIHQNNVPYLSAGVTDNGLTGLSNYFAVSLTYQQQGTLVLKNAQQQGLADPPASNVDSTNMPGTKAKWAVVTADSPNFVGARKGVEAALNAAHIPYKEYNQNQNSSTMQGDAGQFGQQLALNGFKTVFVDMSPGYFVFMTAGYYKQPGAVANWVGPGVTYTEITVAQYICQQSQNEINGHAYFLAPSPGIDKATADFKHAYGAKYDDIEWALWGLSNGLWNLLKDASSNLTRATFLDSTEHAVVPADPYVPIDFRNHGGHFGGTGAWVQKVNCNETEPGQSSAGAWDTVGSNYLRLF
jgi:branched-chain amino acid transport system substrate-binding protein